MCNTRLRFSIFSQFGPTTTPNHRYYSNRQISLLTTPIQQASNHVQVYSPPRTHSSWFCLELQQQSLDPKTSQHCFDRLYLIYFDCLPKEGSLIQPSRSSPCHWTIGFSCGKRTLLHTLWFPTISLRGMSRTTRGSHEPKRPILPLRFEGFVQWPLLQLSTSTQSPSSTSTWSLLLLQRLLSRFLPTTSSSPTTSQQLRSTSITRSHIERTGLCHVKIIKSKQMHSSHPFLQRAWWLQWWALAFLILL